MTTTQAPPGPSTATRVVVVGSGAAGLSAAVAAAAGGAHVTVVEAAPRIGGTTAISGGGIWIPDNPYAAAVGASDSRDEALRYLAALDLGDVDPGLCLAYVVNGMRVIRAIERHTPLRWQLLRRFPDYHPELPGGKLLGRSLEIELLAAPRAVLDLIRADPYGGRPMTIDEESDPPAEEELLRREAGGGAVKGRGLIAGLCGALLELGGTVRTGLRAERLLASDGAVTGVTAGGERFDGRVVLACGGFERDDALVRSFLRGPMLAPAGPPSNRGDGLRMGMAAGADLGNMSEAWWCPAMAIEGETIDDAPFWRMLFLDCSKPGTILVDGRGRRFADESANYNDLGRALHAFDAAGYAYGSSPSFAIFDAARRAREPFGPLLPADPDPAWLVRADTLEQLGGLIGVPGDDLRATVERYNDGVARGTDEFARGVSAYDHFGSGSARLAPLATGPFYAARVVPGCLGTKGGLRIDAGGRVLRADGDGPIDGLFAAGNVAANPFGAGYPGGGATIGPALVFGWAAGESATA